MKFNQIKILAFTSLFILSELFSENLNPEFRSIKSDPSEQSPWMISHNFETISNYSEAIAIPFNYPFEASLLPSYTPQTNIVPGQLDVTQNFILPGRLDTSSANVLIKPSTNTEFLFYRTNIITDNLHYARNTNSRMPSLWQSNSTIANTSSGVVFVYLKKNMGLNLDLSFRMAGNAGHAMFESLVSNINFSYKLSNKILDLNPNYRLNMILQFSSTQYMDERATAKKLEFNKTNLRSQFISSGFTLNTKSVMFEGLIRVPVQQQTVFDIDGMLRPELQGRLGMKWHLPEFIEP